ncbi:MAG: hypothetical protein RBS08_05680 [Bdellovibrionales bacterium]|jgi:hypothetical protein|nr:hypothetical protein [Bdellovibrionales bacterium]
MAFVIFLLLVYGLCLFHRFEHRVMIKDLARLVPFLPLQNGIPAGHDWRQAGGNAETPLLKRAFHIYGKDDVLRYAVPVMAAAVILIALQSFVFAGGYILFCLIKWFCTAAELHGADTAKPAGYKIKCGHSVLWQEDFTQKA